MTHKTTLSNDGHYILEKSLLTPTEICKIRKDLTVVPKLAYQVSKNHKPESFTVYKESKTKFYVPKFYGIKVFGEPQVNEELKGKKLEFKGKIKLREYQEEIVSKTMEQLKTKNGGGICVGCGRGKTIMAIEIARRMKRKTLIIVHKSFLMNQWKERLEEFTKARVGTIVQKTIDVEDKDVVIGMLQSIAKDKYDKKIFNKFGFVIFDEAHHAPSKYFSQALPIITCRKSLFLTATPKRTDCTERVLYWYFGEIAYYEPPSKNDEVNVRIINYELEHKKFKETFMRFTGKVNKAMTITNICKIKERNEFIVNIISDILTTDINRKILLLTERREQISIIEEMLNNLNISNGLYIGGMKEKDLDESSKKDVILATYSMASEGLDIPVLNTLILATPRSNIEQSVGRIMRQKHNKYHPLIYDIVDALPSFTNQGFVRRRFYRKLDYKMTFIDVENNKIVKENKEHENTTVNQKTEIKPDDVDFLSDSDDE